MVYIPCQESYKTTAGGGSNMIWNLNWIRNLKQKQFRWLQVSLTEDFLCARYNAKQFSSKQHTVFTIDLCWPHSANCSELFVCFDSFNYTTN